MIKVSYLIVRKFPILRKLVEKAHMKETAEQFVKRVISLSIMASFTIAILSFFLLDKLVFKGNIGKTLLGTLVMFALSFFVVFSLFIQSPRLELRKREREINKEVLFAGRYLLVKLDSGIPLFNSLLDASRSYGISAKYFKEIVDEIRVGTPIEEALAETRESSPSKYFKLILTELITSLKTGVDVSIGLREILNQITKEQVLEIKTYSKKLNAFMMIYMVLATVMPSLGVTMFIVLGGFMGIPLDTATMYMILFGLAFMQYIFLSILKSMRPMVNL